METSHKGFNSTISANNICTPSINYWLAESLARIFNKAVKAGKSYSNKYNVPFRPFLVSSLMALASNSVYIN